MKIDKIILHHAGGLGTNNLASTQNLTVKNIDLAHRDRWPDFKSSLGYFVGYTFVIEKDGTLTQTRAIGEETAHTIGQNTSSVGIMIMGNFEKGVNIPTIEQKMRLKSLLNNLLTNQPLNVHVVPGTILDMSPSRIYPHRHFAQTSCYGSSLSDIWFKDMVSMQTNEVESVESLVQKIMALFAQLVALISKPKLGSHSSSCDAGRG